MPGGSYESIKNAFDILSNACHIIFGGRNCVRETGSTGDWTQLPTEMYAQRRSVSNSMAFMLLTSICSRTSWLVMQPLTPVDVSDGAEAVLVKVLEKP